MHMKIRKNLIWEWVMIYSLCFCTWTQLFIFFTVYTVCFTVYCFNELSHFWQLINSQSITQMKRNDDSVTVQFASFLCFQSSHINQMKMFPFAQAEVRIAHCNLCVNLCKLVLHPWAALMNKPFGQAVGIGSCVIVHLKVETEGQANVCNPAPLTSQLSVVGLMLPSCSSTTKTASLGCGLPFTLLPSF